MGDSSGDRWRPSLRRVHKRKGSCNGTSQETDREFFRFPTKADDVFYPLPSNIGPISRVFIVSVFEAFPCYIFSLLIERGVTDDIIFSIGVLSLDPFRIRSIL